ncbi:MAG: hypothetical protein MI923_27735 [Phycisphaerales bacterium]|nr:hypothetical protein [Phycisphaerales bacterium]
MIGTKRSTIGALTKAEATKSLARCCYYDLLVHPLMRDGAKALTTEAAQFHDRVEILRHDVRLSAISVCVSSAYGTFSGENEEKSLIMAWESKNKAATLDLSRQTWSPRDTTISWGVIP